jgi:hypothetical protein
VPEEGPSHIIKEVIEEERKSSRENLRKRKQSLESSTSGSGDVEENVTVSDKKPMIADFAPHSNNNLL